MNTTGATKERMATLGEISAEIRASRKGLKQELKARNTLAPEVLRDDFPDWLDNMKIEDFLDAIPYLRQEQMVRILQAAGFGGEAMRGKPISPLMPIGKLTMRQRLLMADMIEEWETKRTRERKKAAA